MLGWQLQAMMLKTARQTSQRSTACAVFMRLSCAVHALPNKEGHVSEDSTAEAVLCCACPTK